MSAKTYQQYCPIAVALDDLGDRWTLLILRELAMGERRFTDLRTALTGIAPNLLSERLRELHAAGLVEQRELPPPAARTVYKLTSSGRDVIPVLRALARFGASRLGRQPDGHELSPRRAVYSLLAPFHTPEAAGQRLHVRLNVDGEIVDVVTDGDQLSLRQRDDETPDVELEVSADQLIAARQGTPVALPAGKSARRFGRLFQLT